MDSATMRIPFQRASENISGCVMRRKYPQRVAVVNKKPHNWLDAANALFISSANPGERKCLTRGSLTT
jgi:hypothetical protein